MKFNWGTGITIAIIAFMAFILFMVFKATTTNIDLEAEDYYEQEIDYQTRINAIENSRSLKADLRIEQNISSIELIFPNDLEERITDGTIQFFKPDLAALDKRFDLKIENGRHKISKDELINGTYIIKVNCTSNDDNYYFEKKVFVNKTE